MHLMKLKLVGNTKLEDELQFLLSNKNAITWTNFSLTNKEEF